MERKLLLAPSMGCCDLFKFEEQVRFIDEHADFLHIDIKDGNYVKTFGVGPDFMKALKPVVKTPMDAHLMVKHPQDYIEACAEAGAEYITPHTDCIESDAGADMVVLGPLALWNKDPDIAKAWVIMENEVESELSAR